MSENFKEVLCPDYYEILTNPNSKVIINDFRFISGILTLVDDKYVAYQAELKKAIIKEEMSFNLDVNVGTKLYNELLKLMEIKKEKLKKDLIVSAHLSNISKKTTIRTAVIFYQNLKTSISQQLDIAFSLITSRLRTFYLRDTNNAS